MELFMAYYLIKAIVKRKRKSDQNLIYLPLLLIGKGRKK